MSERKIGALLSPLLEETTLSDNEHLLLSKRLPRPVGSVQHIGRCKLVSAAGTWWQNFPTDPSPHLCLCLYLYLCLTASALVLAFPLLSPVHRRTNSCQRTSCRLVSQPAGLRRGISTTAVGGRNPIVEGPRLGLLPFCLGLCLRAPSPSPPPYVIAPIARRRWHIAHPS